MSVKEQSGREELNETEVDVKTFESQSGIPKIEFEVERPNETGMNVKLYKKVRRDRKVMRFVVVSDGHYGSTRTSNNLDANNTDGERDEDLKNYILDVQDTGTDTEEEPFDFLIYNGDLVHDDPDWLSEVRENLLEEIEDEIDWHIGGHGNHDYATESEWNDEFGIDRNHKFEIGDYGFICPNSAQSDGTRKCPAEFNSTSSEEVDQEFIEDAFQEFEDKEGVFIVSHITWSPISDSSMDCSGARSIANDQDNFVAFLEGHEHNLKSSYFMDGYFRVCSGTYGGVDQRSRDWDSELWQGVRVVEVYDDGVIHTYWRELQQDGGEGEILYDEDVMCNNMSEQFGYELVEEWDGVDAGEELSTRVTDAGNTDKVYWKVVIDTGDSMEKESFTQTVKGNTATSLAFAGGI